MNTKNSWLSKALVLAFFLPALFLAGLVISDCRVNLTPSHPKGLYRLVPGEPERGDYVAFCLPPENPLADLALRRGYLGRGPCLSGSQVLLKRLAGLPGDYVGLTDSGLILNGLPLTGTAWPEADSLGRDLPASLLSSGLIPAGLALVLSQGHPGSFDSRYFGLIPLAALMKAEPVLIFNKEFK